MPEHRPLERVRAKKGLGARSSEGKTIPADWRGRYKNIGNPEAPAGRGGRSAGAPRAEHARRRTRRDNPEGKS